MTLADVAFIRSLNLVTSPQGRGRATLAAADVSKAEFADVEAK